MKKISTILLFLLGWVITNQAQTLFVYDQKTGEPVSDVFVFNDSKTNSGLTDRTGIIDITKFWPSQKIHFQHSSFVKFELDRETIEHLHYRIPLTEKFVDLNEIVVSASKWETNKNEIPNKIELIKSKDIVFENPQTSAEMLASGNEVFIQKSQLGGGSPMIRGFAANKILFIVDGVRMNNAIYRSGNLHNVLQADVNSVESAEVIFGPGTNIYGSDALGGVVDIHILKPKYAVSKKWAVSGNGMARLTTADFEKTLHFDLNFSNNKWAFLAMLSFSDFDDLKMGSLHNDYTQRPDFVKSIDGQDSIVRNDKPNQQKFSGYSQMNFVSKVSNKFSKTAEWIWGFYLSKTSDVPRYDRLIQYKNDKLKYAEWYYNPQEWMMTNLQINLNGKTSIYKHASFTLAYQSIKEGRNDRKYRDDWLRKRNEMVNVFSFNVDFDKTLPKQNTLFYGIELVHNDVVSRGIKENILTKESKTIASRYPDGGSTYFTAGAYFSYKKNFLRVPMTFLAGLRYSFTSLNSRFTDTSFYKLPYDKISINNSAVTGNVGIVYHPGSLQLNLNFSSGFRAPNLDDVAKIFDSEPGNVVVPNENLKPEYLYNTDLGISYNFEDRAKLRFNLFYSYLDNAMVRRDFNIDGQDSILYEGEMSKVQAMVNTGYAQIYGLSFSFDFQIISLLKFSTTLTYTKGIDDEGFAMRHAPPLFGSSALIFEKNLFKLALSANYNAEVSYQNLAPTERSKAYLYGTDADGKPYAPAWWTLNLKGSYRFSESFLVTFGVENILDYRYRPYSSGITASGRNFIFAFRYSF